MTVARIAASMAPDLVERLKADAEARGESVSAWLAEAAEERLRRANLDRLMEQFQEDFGEFTEEELRKARELWPA